ncbi:MAG TPA: glycosyltransferase family 87 protein, partial [Rubrobacteraceae bacterium]|nr:glycosyltransferase family 87 protein [Rubrobacteraceae bacterium]
IWGPLALVFALAFLRTDKLFSLRNLDVVALLGFLVSHGFFREGVVYEAVLLWYAPLLYLFVRTLLLGFGVGERVERTSTFPSWLLILSAALASGLVIYLNLDSRVIDVGYAGVVGADRILDGTLPYGNMPDDVGTGDTYGPLNYLLYVPSVLVFGFSGEWDFLPAAHATTICAFVTGALALLIAGWRLSGPKVGAALLFAWCVFPYTLYSANNNTNDIVVAAICAVGLAFVTSPLGRGATIAAGFAVKLYPIILGPLWLLHDGARPRRSLVDFILGGLGVVLLTFWVLLLDGRPLESIKLFYAKTIAFQGDRETPWTVFAQVPELAFLQQPLLAGVVFLAFIVAVWPKKRTVRRLAAFSAALVIGFQITTNYWFYPYVTWFEPFVFLALLPATDEKSVLDGRHDATDIEPQQDQETSGRR